MIAQEYSFIHYLKAKKSVDDRAINGYVWKTMAGMLPGNSPHQPVKVFEAGAGIGTMLARMVEWDLIQYAEYTCLDHQPRNIQQAQIYLQEWAGGMNLQAKKTESGLVILGEKAEIKVDLIAADFYEFMSASQVGEVDLFLANAFLDLVSLPGTLENIFDWLGKDVLYYFSINYDGLTIFEPLIDEDFDHLVLTLYDSTMNARYKNGVRFGDHQAGRHLLNYIPGLGGSILAAGSSDWIVHPVSGEYPGDEVYFLHYIIDTIHQALDDHQGLDQSRLLEWIGARHAQVERRELVYIAHQVDLFGRTGGLDG